MRKLRYVRDVVFRVFRVYRGKLCNDIFFRAVFWGEFFNKLRVFGLVLGFVCGVILRF